MREVMKLGAILLIITAVAAGLLGYTNAITEGPIANQILQANIIARQSVLPEAENFEEMSKEIFTGFDTVIEVHKGVNNGQTVGYTVKTNPGGYGGPVEVMVGISSDAVITGVSVGNHSETPGLGAKAADENFRGQYSGKNATGDLTVIKAGAPKENEIMAISGATITSRAVTSGVNTAVKLFNEKLK